MFLQPFAHEIFINMRYEIAEKHHSITLKIRGQDECSPGLGFSVTQNVTL
jgi:hypothetical protein